MCLVGICYCLHLGSLEFYLLDTHGQRSYETAKTNRLDNE
jgi:hypothetical protein